MSRGLPDRHRLHLTLLLPTLLACQPRDQNPAPLNALEPMWLAEVPTDFRGLWVSDPALCDHPVGDRGQRVLIAADRIDNMNVTGVQFYAGGMTFVHLTDGAGDAWNLSLSPTPGGQRLQIASSATGFDAELLRCRQPEASARSLTSATSAAEQR